MNFTELVPKFEVFPDRLEITSAGVVHSDNEQEDFFAGYSNPRNKTLMRVFKDLEMVEYLGSGMPRILKAYSRDAYVFTTHFIRITLPISKEALELEKEVGKESLKESTQTGKSSGKSSGKTSKIILSILLENPTITVPEIAEKLKISTRAVAKHLASLRAENQITRIGGRKFGQWEVIKS